MNSSMNDMFTSYLTNLVSRDVHNKVEQTVQQFAETWIIWKITPQNHGSECGICKLELWNGDKVRYIDPCNHHFHYECIFRYVQRKSTNCPNCSKKIKPKLFSSSIDPLAKYIVN